MLPLHLQILPYDPRNNPHSHAPFLVNLCHGKAHVILFPRCPVIVAGMGHRIDTVGQADIYHALIHVCHPSGILALDAALFQVLMVCVLGHALDIRLNAHILQVLTPHAQDAHQHLISHGETLVGIPNPVPCQIPGHDGAFHTKDLHPDDLFRHGDHPCLDNAPLIDTVHPRRIRIQIEDLPLFQHGLPAAGYHTAGLGINALHNEVDLRPQHISEDLVLAQHQLRIFLS